MKTTFLREPVQSAVRLEQEGINCSLILLFAFEKASLRADVEAFAISPLVVRNPECNRDGVARQRYVTDRYGLQEAVEHSC